MRIDKFLGPVSIQEPSHPRHITAKAASWYLITIGLTILSLVVILSISAAGNQAYIRYALASVLTLFLPGFALLNALLPTGTRKLVKENRLDGVTRFALSVVLSIAVVSILGLVLDFTSWGVTLNSLVLSLSLFILFFSTIALVREHRSTNNQVGESAID